jgi:maltose alpha-D-glucosyltransferase/alpha-amylase
LRQSEPALAAYAEFVPLYAQKNTYPLVYYRAKGSDVVLVVINPAQNPASAEFDFQVPYARLKLLAGKAPAISREGGKMALKITGRSYAIYRLER